MSDIAASSMASAPGRQLLVEFAVAGQAGCDRQLLEQVIPALHGLNLQPAQLERIRQAFGKAAARAACRGEPAAGYRLRIRVWVLGACASGRDWGFFLLEKGDDSQHGWADTDQLVELFLYQEGDS